MSRNRMILIGAGAVVLIFAIGYIWGASGRFTAENALGDVRLQLDLAEARGHLLDGRVALYNVNFGEASRQFEDAKAPLRHARDRFQQTGRNAAAGHLTTALGQIDEAQKLAAKLDQSANSKAAEALEAIRAATTQ
jgi:hypothetical protein